MNSTNSTPKHTSSDELLEYFWPFPYPEHKPPIEVIFSNGLPESDDDKDHMIFQIPYSTFKTAIEAYISKYYILKADVVEVMSELEELTHNGRGTILWEMDTLATKLKEITESLNLEGVE